MCVEEILFTECNKIILIHEKLDNFSKDYEYKYIIDCVNLLVNCRRTRLSKYILGYYGLGMDYGLCSLEQKDEKTKLKEFKLPPLRRVKDSDELVNVVNKFYMLFKINDYDCFYYALKTFYKFGCAGTRFGNKRKAMYFIWEILFYEVDK